MQLKLRESFYTVLDNIFIFVFLFLNILKVLFFHAELVEYNQDFTNIVYVILFISAWTILFFFSIIKNIKSLFIIFYLLQLLYLSVNFSYFQYYGSYLSIRQALSLVGEFGGLVRSMSIPIHAKLLVFFIDLPILGLLVRRNLFKNFPKFIRRFFVLSALVLLALLYTYKFIMTADSVTKSDRARFIGNYGLLTLQVHDYLVADDYRQLMDPAERPVVTGVNAGESLKNVILIQVEALDANILQYQHNKRPVMPNLLSLAKENIYFPYVLSYHKGGGTSDAEFSIVNSVEPLDDYAAINLPDYPYENSFIKQLNDNGYYTAAFHGNIGKYWNRTEAFSSMGFDEFYDLEAMDLQEYGWGARDEDLFDFVEKKLQNEKEPFFYLIITMSSHGPYKNVKRYYNNDRFDDVPESNNDQAYLNSMAYVDREIDNFIEDIRNELSDSYVFIYGDHSEYYSENGVFRRGAKNVNGDRLEFVPLIIIPPEDGEYEENKIAVSFLDFAPTILEAAHADYRVHTHGIDILGEQQESTVPPVPFKGHFYDRDRLLEIGYSSRE